MGLRVAYCTWENVIQFLPWHVKQEQNIPLKKTKTEHYINVGITTVYSNAEHVLRECMCYVSQLKISWQNTSKPTTSWQDRYITAWWYRDAGSNIIYHLLTEPEFGCLPASTWWSVKEPAVPQQLVSEVGSRSASKWIYTWIMAQGDTRPITLHH